jgi:hypothetical protein
MLDFLEWLSAKLALALGHPEFTAAAIGLVLGMGAVEFTARMLPADTKPTIATRISWAVACLVAFAVAFGLNPTALGFALALTAAVVAPTLELVVLRYLALRWPNLMPQSMCETPAKLPPADIHWP